MIEQGTYEILRDRLLGSGKTLAAKADALNKRRIEVFGEKGMLRAENQTPTTLERFGAEATCGDNPWPNFQARYAAAYAAELSSFISSVQRRKPAEVPPEDSRRVLLLCEAARKSSQTGAAVKIKN